MPGEKVFIELGYSAIILTSFQRILETLDFKLIYLLYSYNIIIKLSSWLVTIMRSNDDSDNLYRDRIETTRELERSNDHKSGTRSKNGIWHTGPVSMSVFVSSGYSELRNQKYLAKSYKCINHINRRQIKIWNKFIWYNNFISYPIIHNHVRFESKIISRFIMK